MEYQYNYGVQNNGYYQQPGGFYAPGLPQFDRRGERKRIFAISGFSAGAIISFLVLSFLVGSTARLVFPDFDKMLDDSFFFNSLNMFSSAVLIFIPFLVAYLLMKKRKIAGELVLGAPYDKKNFALLIPVGLMICIIGNLATSYFSMFVDNVFGIEFLTPDDYSDYNSVSGLIMAVVSTAIIPAFVEEFAIRGVVMQSLRRYGDKYAIIMSALVFALMHGNMIQIPFAFIAGIGIGYAVVKTGTMWTGIIIHFINNLTAVFSLAAYENLSEANMALFSSVLYIAVFALGIVCLIIYSRRNPGFISSFSKGEVYYLRTSEKVGRFLLNPLMLISICVLCVETATYIKFGG